MGILDDAIREHLDLKRRRGADPAEIERAEREALGPVRRGPEDVDEGLPGQQLAGEEQLGYEEHDEYAEPGPYAEAPEYEPEAEDEGWGESFDEETRLFGAEREPAFGHVPTAEPPLEEDELPAEPPRAEPHDGELEPEPEPELTQPPAPEPPRAEPPARPEPPVQGPPEPPSAHLSDETAEYDVSQELGKEGEDVLEETPEFLQDTPDHDRLWFEQRPPRDFDFEG